MHGQRNVKLSEDLCKCMIISRPVLLKMRNFGKKYRANQNTYFMVDNVFPKSVPFTR